MSPAVQAILYAVVLWAAWAAGKTQRRSSRQLPYATVVAIVVVGVPSVLQLTLAPELLAALSRTSAELQDGELWRLVTSLLVQDGGVWGAAFNLVALGFIGLVAERTWGWRRWLVIGLGSGVAAQFWGLLVQPAGAGNSVANFGLAASVSVVAVASGNGLPRAAGILSLLVGLVLLVLADIHGGAVVIGAAMATSFLLFDRSQFAQPH